MADEQNGGNNAIPGEQALLSENGEAFIAACNSVLCALPTGTSINEALSVMGSIMFHLCMQVKGDESAAAAMLMDCTAQFTQQYRKLEEKPQILLPSTKIIRAH